MEALTIRCGITEDIFDHPEVIDVDKPCTGEIYIEVVNH